ncbi:MAG: elongation factor P--(R)-beta-lysine ligase [Gammaproteobacteria bacterium]|nr:elongation factor P--(R)-beta-lysine ligase [Gammaproteobacteria bacterium]
MITDWQPSASLEILGLRAQVLSQIREFMAKHVILEVETPVLIHSAVSDPNIQSFSINFHKPNQPGEEKLYLHTSPEYAMKRLLAAGSGPIYQIIHVFRDYESGKLHNPEFTLLEWYRPGYDYHNLMDEVGELIHRLGFKQTIRMSYGDVFDDFTGIDPHQINMVELQKVAKKGGLHTAANEKSVLLDFIFSNKIAPNLGHDQPTFIYDYPACQCALAKLNNSVPPQAERFELFISGIEIANGFNELCDVSEQRKRFEQEARYNSQTGKTDHIIDQRLLDAMISGLPECAGVAIGIDRLLMVIKGYDDINLVIAFPVDRA